ncbi:hypothetical protein ACHAXT_003081 [Thalassiosira profunda]
MGSELEAPLLAGSGGSAAAAPRILDRDGTFSQSRGRWSVANTNSRSSAGFGAARQRRAAAPSASSPGDDGWDDNSSNAPRGVSPSITRRPQHAPNANNSCCCAPAEHPGRRCWDDWFHTLSYTPTCILMFGVFVAYFITIVIFAGLYLTVNKVGSYYGGSGTNHGGGEQNDIKLGDGDGGDVDISSFCGMDINNHMEALYFSLSTMATIGYGTSDYYFGECWTPFLLVLLQVFAAIVFSSLAIGLLFQRMSRGQKRGRTIVFSDVAVVRKVRGRWYWMFRVAELRKRHIIGAKVRVFCVRHERCPVALAGGGGGEGGNVVELETAHFVSHPLPLLDGSQSTNATNGSAAASGGDEEDPHSDGVFEQSILMGLPHVLVHRMDALSPLMPPRPVWYDEGGVPHTHGPAGGPLATVSESPTESAAADGTPGETSSSLLATTTGGKQPTASSLLGDQPTQEEITHFLQDRQAEMIVFLEGICEVTGMALQARHSYRMEDIAFHQTFAPCVFPAVAGATATSEGKRWNPFANRKAKVEQDPRPSDMPGEEVYVVQPSAALEIDFSQFHDLRPAPLDSISCPYIPSSSLRRR